MKVSQARGSILLALHEKCVGIFEYTPLQVKQALTGYGRAEKADADHGAEDFEAKIDSKA